jgi:hypothetical protein
MPKAFSAIYVSMAFFIAAIIVFSANLVSLGIKTADAQQSREFVITNGDVDEKNKLVVVSKVNIENISKT